MYGFKQGDKLKKGAKPAGGMIEGPGTGTSDSIKTEIPRGSYIMPADSTEAIGPKALEKMGKGGKVPARVSAGEYQMPPEQVHAIGVQALDQMRGATHAPVEPRGFKPQQEGELYFADGGIIGNAAQYWADDNARFEAGNPSFGSRVGRALNPVTSFGSAMGAMHSAAGNGDKTGMALAAAQAIPVFGAMRAVATPAAGAIKAAQAMAPSAAKTGAAIAGSGAAGAMADTYETTADDQITGFANGGVVESTDDLIARISAKYGTGASPQPTAPAPQPAAQRVAPAAAPTLGGAMGALRSRRQRIDEAAGYVNGGEVDDEKQPRGFIAQTNANRAERTGGAGMYAGANQQLAQGVRSAFPNTTNAIRGAGQNIGEAYQAGGAPAAVGATVRNTFVPAMGFAADVGRSAKMLIDPAANALKTAVTGDPTPIGARPQGATAPRGAQAATTPPQSAATLPDTRMPATDEGAAVSPASTPSVSTEQGFGQWQQGATQMERDTAADAYRGAWQARSPGGMRNADANATALYNAEQATRGTGITAQRQANGTMSFSGDGATAMPQSFTQGFDLNQANAAMARANAIRQSALDGQQGGGGVIGNSAVDETNARFNASRERDAMRNMGRTRVNAMTQERANETQRARLAAEQGWRANELASTDAYRAGTLENQAQDFALRRDEMGARQQESASRLGLEQQRAEREGREFGFRERGLQRTEALYAQYDAAKTPEERAAVAAQIRALNGKEEPSRFTVVPGGQEFDPAAGMPLTRQSRVFNQQTGEFVDPPGTRQNYPPVPQRDQLQAGQIYQTARGPARWDGKQFVATGQ